MRAVVILALALLPALVRSETTKPRVAHRHSLVLKVGSPAQVSDQIIAATEGQDGYFIERTDQTLRLKLPVANVKPLLAAIEPLGVVVERQQEAQDLGELMDERRTRLASKQEVLQRYFAVLSTAGASSVVEVEREMTALVAEIESLKGALLMYEHQLQYADVVVNFQFRERRPPVRDGSSSFRWLNSMNLADLVWGFGHD